MKNVSKVVGLIHSKNEWPLLALSISHALMYNVDEVYVLNHGSVDQSSEGLQHLQKLWNNRIHIFNWYDERYWQEVFANALIMIGRASSPEWFYVFDADEFLITREFRPLKSIVNDVDPKYSSIRYEVQNWISTEGFDETDLNQYRMLRYRSVANSFIEMHPAVYVDEILAGNLNFFDVHFPSKVVFRNDGPLWLEAGAHHMRKPIHFQTLTLSADELRVAHFPLLSRRKLERKVKHGQRLNQDGFPATHGWQSQMIYKFSQENKLDEFWHSHTISAGNDSNSRTLPSHIIEDGFVQAIEPTLRLIEKSLDSSMLTVAEGDLSTRRLDDSPIPFCTIVPLARNLQFMLLEWDKLINERDAAITERDALINSLSWRYTEFIRRIFRYARTCI
jgi:hypothetical protein